MESCVFPLPPLPEQQRIVDRIESLFAKLDEAKQKARDARDSFETRKAAILHRAFTGELTAQWKKEHGVGMESWERLKLGEIGTLERGRSQHRPRNDPRLFGGPYPFIQTGDVASANVYIMEHHQTLSEFGMEQSRMFSAGTLCITIAANIGDVAILSYAGYQPKLNDEGKISSVRYQFETTNADAPKYVQFNDHGHESGEAEHFHIYFGNDGFDTLMDSKTNPFFVKDALTVDEILDELMGHEHEEEKDEHVWLSLKNAEVLVNAISKSLQEIDPDNKDTYATNSDAYVKKLSALDADYQAAVDGATYKTVLFGDRFPFRYLVDDYGLSYYAAFVGCSAETEASFETISFLAKKVDELKLPCILTIEGAQHKIAETIVQNTTAKNQKVLTMDSMQSTTSKDVANGTTYLYVMEKNLSVLKEALD